jgi:hypothetical protein
MSQQYPQPYDPQQQPQVTPPQWQPQQYPYHQQLPPVLPPGYAGQPDEQGWYPAPQFTQPPVHVNVHQNNYGPSGAITVTGMSQGWKIFHAVMIICTCGFWLPVYWAHNSSAKRRSVTRFR